jgi:hypothetical protein
MALFRRFGVFALDIGTWRGFNRTTISTDSDPRSFLQEETHVRTAIVSAIMLTVATPSIDAQVTKVYELKPVEQSSHDTRPTLMPASQKADKANEARRCAFLGPFGSFHLIGPKGTAAYLLGNEKYIADLVPAGEDANWWLYRPGEGSDPGTTMWAFSRHDQCNGMRSVLRFVNGVWCLYEEATGWGNDGSTGVTVTTVSSQPSNAELLQKLRDIEDTLSKIPRKLNAIQRGNSPSLQELSDEIQKITPTTDSKSRKSE